MGHFIDISGQTFGSLTVLSYLGNEKWLCKCSCGNISEYYGSRLRTGKSTQCRECSVKNRKNNNKFEDLTGKTFNSWKVLEYAGKSTWKCQCQCGRIVIVEGSSLKNGGSKSCKNCASTRDIQFDLTGQVIGQYTVIEYNGNGSWKCRCSCGNERVVKGYNLRKAKELGKDIKCDECSYKDKLQDLTNRQFGNWLVKRYLGNQMWECECQCNNHIIKAVSGKSLKNGTSTSCGCLSASLMIDSKLEKYGEINSYAMIKGNRTIEQIMACGDRDKLSDFIDKHYYYKPKAKELANDLGISETFALRKIHSWGLDDKVSISDFSSQYEIDIQSEILKLQPDIEIIRHDRKILSGKELDIYIPNRKFAIEVNGNYWHSSLNKDKYYHRNKTLACKELGIRLVHVFEYEWLNDDTRNKIIDLIHREFGNINKVYARNTEVFLIKPNDALEFFNKYHLQSGIASDINIGLVRNNEVLAVMAFGKPRFDNNYNYELLRYCVRPDVKIVGGAQRIFSAFINNYSPSSIVTYCDTSKFTGNTYDNLGFTYDGLTEPSYVWVKDSEVLSRYQTMKHKLLEKGLGKYGNTENEIMNNLGYFKIYNCGNSKYTWKR